MGKILKRLFLLIIIVISFYIIPTRNLDVNEVYQYPNMPNGCEIASLSMIMNYSGFGVSKEKLSDNYLKKSGLDNADPNKAYIGNPYSKSGGFYCYAPPIKEAGDRFFSEIGSSSKVDDKTGMGIFGVLNNVIFNKRPVAVWYTIDDKSPTYIDKYYKDESGESHQIQGNLHCVVVDGIGMGRVSIVDPIQGRRNVSILQFTKIYYEMGKKSVVIS